MIPRFIAGIVGAPRRRGKAGSGGPEGGPRPATNRARPTSGGRRLPGEARPAQAAPGIATVPADDERRDALEVALAGRGAYELFACDPALADTAAFCAAYGSPSRLGQHDRRRRQGQPAVYADCVCWRRTASTSTARWGSPGDPQGIVCGARRDACPDGQEIARDRLRAPASLPLWIDAAVMARERIVLGGGSRSWKVLAPPSILLTVAGAEVVDGLAYPALIGLERGAAPGDA